MQNKVLFSFLIFLLFSLVIKAQEAITVDSLEVTPKKTIVEELNTSYANQGRVFVFHDETILPFLSKTSQLNIVSKDDFDPSLFEKVSGYKILVFAGNNQRVSKDEAYAKEELLKDKFPELFTEVSFRSPRWILHAGNFRTRKDAETSLYKLRRTFPVFGKEMYIVESLVIVPRL